MPFPARISQTPFVRAFGWIAAGVSSAALLSGAAVTLAAQRPADPAAITLDLSQTAAAPSLAAVADPAPRVQDEAPARPSASPSPEVTPPSPEAEAAPVLPRLAATSSPPEPEKAVAADLPPPPSERAEVAAVKPETRPRRKPETPPEHPPEKVPDPARPAQVRKKAPPAKALAAAATAPKVANRTAAGGTSPAAYAKAVMKKVRATRKKKGAGAGTVVVGFSIASDGGLASLTVLQGSGDGALDRVALDHIQRSAPFAPPPDGAGRDFSFKFVGR